MVETQHDKFMQATIDAGKKFLAADKKQTVALVSHFDTDGLCATVIMQKALEREGYNCKVYNEPHLNTESLEALVQEDFSTIIFTDIGATKVAEISKLFSGKTVVILDHHMPDSDSDLKVVIHLNPHLFGITERNALSGAGVAYFFALGMNSKNRELAWYAVLGAIGDTQEKQGFEELNNRILQHAIIQKTISVGKRLRLYGINSRPLIKVLEYSTDLSIPGVTNDPEGVKLFLDGLGIEYEWRGRLKKFYHLRPFEQERLTKKILDMKRDEDPKTIIAPSYTLLNEQRRELQDMREYATIINACGRLEDYQTGLDALKGNFDAQKKAIMNLRVYKSAIRDALQYVDRLRETNTLYLKEAYVIINFGNRLKSSLVGIIASILARNKHYPKGTVVCTMAKHTEDLTKVSLRVSHDVTDKQLQVLLKKAVEPLGADTGGHNNAAGSIIQSKDEETFILNLEKELQA